MAYQKPAPKHDWRSFLTVEEAKVISRAEKRRDRARREMAESSSIIGPIQNRAIQRSRYASKVAG